MSYDVSLRKGGRAITVPRHVEGGIYAIGGTEEAWLNVTYNYGKFIFEGLGFGLRNLDGMTAQGALPYLEAAVSKLGDDRDADYWAPTAGNAGHVLSVLRDWARQAVSQELGDAVFGVG